MINKNFQKLSDSYLFTEILKKTKDKKDAIRMGIGDVTRPLAPVVVEAMQKAVVEMGSAKSFRGYGLEQGYPFLRQAVCGYYARKGVELKDDEAFIGDGAGSDIGNVLDIFSRDNSVLIPDPVYPAYVDNNLMMGHEIFYMNGNADNGFLPMPDQSFSKAKIIYICSPNNPTGAVYSADQLKLWVDYAIANDAVILFDAAYEIFVQDKDLPTSIFQIEGAKKCAIEFSSLSKTAGFTGTRCSYTVVPHELIRDGTPLNKLWKRRQETKFNGLAYIVQRGAEAFFTDEGIKQSKENIAYYMQNAKHISETLQKLGIWHTGGKNAPYIWLKCLDDMTSWEFFDYLLANTNIVGTPGSGFGANGEGFFRLSSFGSKESVCAAMENLTREVN